MSITFEIVKFKKPTKDDLSNLHMFNPYGSIPILDDDGDSTEWNIYMFRADDKDIQNIINSSYVVKMELSEYVTDYDGFFEDLGFPKEAVRNGDVRIIKSNSRYITISYGNKSKEIEKGRLEKYKVMVQTKCVVLKIKALWNSSENNLYGMDKKKAIKCIPDIENYEYVPVNNSMLAKAEIPFLIFERNSTVDFLVFTRDAGEDGIEVRVQNGDVWLTQKAISQLFDVDRSVVTKHLSNIFKEGELDENSTCANFAQVADNGKTYNYKFYSLAAIIAVGYRINSERAMQFRTWATKVLDTFTKQGYVLDKSRLINGQIFDEDYFEHLIAEIQEIRASERRFYQKITDIYATAVDYDKNSQVTREFYATVQNKMHYAVHGNTAAEVIVARANHNKKHMGLKSWKNAPDGKIVKTDVSIAKNYLEKEELVELNEIVTMYLDYATRQARRHIPMTMEDWKTKLDAFLRFNDAEVLQDKGKVTAAIAKEFAESEFEKYRVIQDSLYESDFDKLMNDMEKDGTTH